MTEHLPSAVNCPVCGERPTIDRCLPWPPGHGPAPYYAGCHGNEPIEHFVGVNADSVREVIEAWNMAATPLAPAERATPTNAVYQPITGKGVDALDRREGVILPATVSSPADSTPSRRPPE